MGMKRCNRKKTPKFISRNWLCFLQLADLKQNQSVFLLSWGSTVLYRPLHRNAGVTLLFHRAQGEVTSAKRLEQTSCSKESSLQAPVLCCTVLYSSHTSALLASSTTFNLVLLFFVGVSDIKRGLKVLKIPREKILLCGPPCWRTHKQQGQNAISWFLGRSGKQQKSDRFRVLAGTCKWWNKTIFCSQHRNRAVTIHQGLSQYPVQSVCI